MPSKPGLVVLVSHELTVSFSATRSKAHDTVTAHNFPALAPDISVDSRLSPVWDSGGNVCGTVPVGKHIGGVGEEENSCLLHEYKFVPLPICYPSNTVPHTSSPGILPVEKTLRFRKCQVKQKKMGGSESVK